jgi:hypothetical protein
MKIIATSSANTILRIETSTTVSDTLSTLQVVVVLTSLA